MKNKLLILPLLILALNFVSYRIGLSEILDENSPGETDIIEKNNTSGKKIIMYYFYGRGCPACDLIKKEIDELPGKYIGRLEIRKYEVWYDDKNRAMLLKMAKERGVDKNKLGTPAIVIGNDLYVGNKMDIIKKMINKNF